MFACHSKLLSFNSLKNYCVLMSKSFLIVNKFWPLETHYTFNVGVFLFKEEYKGEGHV